MVKIPPGPVGRTRPSDIQVMVGVGSPAAVQAMECAVFSNTELLLTEVMVGGTAGGWVGHMINTMQGGG
jgi:hypothetical protein